MLISDGRAQAKHRRVLDAAGLGRIVGIDDTAARMEDVLEDRLHRPVAPDFRHIGHFKDGFVVAHRTCDAGEHIRIAISLPRRVRDLRIGHRDADLVVGPRIAETGELKAAVEVEADQVAVGGTNRRADKERCSLVRV